MGFSGKNVLSIHLFHSGGKIQNGRHGSNNTLLSFSTKKNQIHCMSDVVIWLECTLWVKFKMVAIYAKSNYCTAGLGL